jgi:predicted small lipoprotein YifL
MKNLRIKSAALAALLSLAACGSGPSDSDVSQAMTAAMSGLDMGKQVIKDSKCAKAAAGDAWECDFLWEGSARHGRFAKLGDGWKLVGQLG